MNKIYRIVWKSWIRIGMWLGFNCLDVYAPENDTVVGVTFSSDINYVRRVAALDEEESDDR